MTPHDLWAVGRKAEVCLMAILPFIGQKRGHTFGEEPDPDAAARCILSMPTAVTCVIHPMFMSQRFV